jgi:hypothetical protein
LVTWTFSIFCWLGLSSRNELTPHPPELMG